MLNYINTRWSIFRRLLLIALVAFLPTIFIVRLIYVSDLTQIATTKAELSGLKYHSDVWSAMISPVKSGTPQIGETTRDALAHYDSKTAAAATAFLNSPKAAERAEAGEALISRISGASGIALDPEAATYYLGDIITIQVPGAYNHLASALALTEGPVSAANQAALGAQLALIEHYVAALSNDLGWLSDVSGASAVAVRIRPQVDRVVQSYGEMANLRKTGGLSDGKAIRTLLADLETASKQLQTVASKELEQLLNARIFGLWSIILTNTAIVAGLCLFGVVMSLSIARSLAASLRMQIKSMEQINQGDKEAEIFYAGCPNENGTMAAALSLLKKGMLERQQLAEETEKQLLEQKEIDAYYSREHEKFMAGFLATSGKIANGDFTARLKGEFIKEYEALVSNINQTAEQLQKTEREMAASEHMRNAVIAALEQTYLTIEFDPEGTIIAANDSYLAALGYSASNIIGKHQSTIAGTSEGGSPQVQALWSALKRGEWQKCTTKRVSKTGKDVWLQATYNPVRDMNGKLIKIVAFALDVTAEREKTADYIGQIEAISRTQAVIEFLIDGTIVNANENFLQAMGYTLGEIKGRHHSIFVDRAEKDSEGYRQLWAKLARGEFVTSEFRLFDKSGKEIWINGTYNAILDANGKVTKVIKIALDVTARVNARDALQLAVQQTKDVVEAAQNNDLTKRTPMDGKTGEIAELCGGVNGLLDTMSGVVNSIASSSSTIANASRELAIGNTELSQRTEEQAASLEQTAASLSKFTSTVKLNAENAQKANDLATSASQVANKGGQVVAEVIHTMDGISQASRKIADIIGVIDEISFQTNILALNAAVEAARAGEQGRGFAVVASEVRSLAQRSTNAAKEIKTLISDSVNKVEAGTKLVASAGKTMEDLVAGVQGVSRIMSEISAASREQSDGIEQVNTAVTQMDKMTQQNAALVEEAAAAAKSMEEQTSAMESVVSAFRVGSDGERRNAVAPTGNPVVDKAFRKASGGASARPSLAKAAPQRPASQPAAAPAKRRAAGGKTEDDWTEF